MITEALETERKYEADPDAVVPDLTGLPHVAGETDPEEFELVAEYFDTEDLRLIRAGITLRRRRGGDDEGWHLKLPAGPDSRTELQVPLRRGSAVPAELSRLIRAQSRTAALRPVARIATLRRRRVLLDGAGESLAEVVDDEVSAQSMGQVTTLSRWREVEVELTGGGRLLLVAADDRLRKAGLRPAGRAAKLERALADRMPSAAAPPRLKPRSRAGDVVLSYLRGQADALKSADPLVRRDQPDAVHQMRVAARRLRAVLQSFRPILEASATAHLRDELRWLGQVLGAARDGEVLTGHLTGLLGEVPEELVLGPVSAGITEHFAPRNTAAQRAAVRALDSRRYVALLDELEGLLTEPPLTDAAAAPAMTLRQPVERAYRRLHKRIRRALDMPAGHDKDLALHEARKAAKRARYTADVLIPIAGRPARRFSKRMTRIQTVLGDHQDLVVARAAIRDLGVRASRAGENAFTYGLLYERDAETARKLQHRARRVWRKASRAKYRHWLAP
jgi:CHAD domain-containing protein